MQNSSLSLLAAFCLSAALFAAPVCAQSRNAAVKPAAAQTAEKAETGKPVPEAGAKEAGDAGKADAKPAANTAGKAEQQPAENAAKAEERKQLEAELHNTDVNSAEILDFPARTSLGEMEMATLPGAKESLITGPASMAPSVSTKDLPSEQLLGRITSEVFQEMADLERGNVFLKLQMQKEQLKNDLEKLKAAYRQSRLEEIAKREDVVRSRIAWWQEQEAARLEMEKKKAETEAIEQQIAEAEELRNKLREEAIAQKEAVKKNALEAALAEAALPVPAGQPAETAEQPQTETKAEAEEIEVKVPYINETYALVSVRGMKTKLSATLKSVKDNSVLTVKKGDNLPTGHHVLDITRDSLIAGINDRKDILLLTAKASADETAEEPKEKKETKKAGK